MLAPTTSKAPALKLFRLRCPEELLACSRWMWDSRQLRKAGVYWAGAGWQRRYQAMLPFCHSKALRMLSLLPVPGTHNTGHHTNQQL